jgi:hypothetical protein
LFLQHCRAGYIDQSGSFIIQPRFDEALGFSEGLATIKVGEKWGYVNKLGGVVILPEHDESFGELLQQAVLTCSVKTASGNP